MKRSPLPPRRKPIRQRGAKWQREQVAWTECREAVIARAGRRCEAYGLTVDGEPVCDYRGAHLAVHVHHVWPEDRDGGRHDPDRCLLLCASSHSWAHAHPAQASTLGLLRPKS